MSVCFSNSLPIDEYLNILIVAAFSNKNLYLLAFPDDKAEILAVCLSKF